jgi:hypothetical protein
MSAYSGAFGSSGGFNQSGGQYFIALSSIAGEAQTYTPGSGSGALASVGSFATYAWGNPNTYPSTLVGTSKVIKDMGKTVVSASRTFRKFQAVTAESLSTNGVTGPEGSGANPGYLTFYLELNKESGGVSAPVPIARYA